ncbi:integral membrane efflux protein [Streptomyces viridochromogenes DSM 40736]|uniref:Integral membrane efflux protein n=1 Tax=Streptomyces viridochromogenes (strain DSM 40736 / JCM 4977 / BCRC 1201 / Tue 494) TaxID=591159 RepID=D9X0M1_STRVT|nr:MFS transporter [Streptomyces viridochromogenes]EFL31285.1 integral membrane efflux protein [Streptomyces viridochromogenes DSM 40736]
MTTKTTWPLLRVLRDRDAGLYLSGAVVSGFGTSALWLASGVWVKDLTGSDGLAALCMLAMWLPALAGPLLGTVADRHRRKPVLIGVNVLLAALLLTLVGVDSAGELWLLYGVLFVYGAAGVVHDAAESALVSAAVDPALLGDFNGLRMTATEGMKLLAPLAGAGLYAAYGGASVALLDAGTFVLATGMYAVLRVREERPVRPTGGRRRQTAEGARHLWAHPGLRPLVVAGGATMLCAGGNGALVYAVVDDLGHSPAYAGVLYAVQGAGSVAVGLLSGTALRRLGERRFAAYGIALLAVAVALRAVPSDPSALVCGAAIGAGLPAVLIATLTSVQRETPGPLLGRVTATAHTMVYTPNVLGLAIGAALVELVSHRLVLVALGAALLVTAAVLLQRPSRAGATAGW